MKVDIYQRMIRDFGFDAASVRKILVEVDARTKGLISDRLIRSMIYLSEGSLEQFKVTLELARTDPRDVYWQAECDCGETQLRDFTKPFNKNE
jgi:hypothetical protein